MRRVLLVAIVLVLAPCVTFALDAPRQPNAEARAEQMLRQAMDLVRDARSRVAAATGGEAPRPGTAGLDAARAALIGAESRR